MLFRSQSGNQVSDLTDSAVYKLRKHVEQVDDSAEDESFVDKDGDRWYLDEYGDKGGGMDMDYMWNYR